MIPYKEIKQGSVEWSEIRYRKIGGTRSKGLFVKSDTLLDEMLAEFTEELEIDYDEYISDDMLRGMELEPEARQALFEYTKIPFVECGWLQCEEMPLLGISPDGISECLQYSCEIKCPAAKKHVTTIRTRTTPIDNLHQCLHYFTVNPNLKEHYFCSYRPESIQKMFVEKFTWDTLVDFGLTRKEKIKSDKGKGEKEYIETLPDIRTIRQWSEVAISNAIALQLVINLTIDKLKM